MPDTHNASPVLVLAPLDSNALLGNSRLHFYHDYCNHNCNT